jgi:ethanolamine utilization protein EutA
MSDLAYYFNMYLHEGHDHDDDEHDHDLENNALWIMDNIELKSVGIDIGSSGTQVIFSLLKLRRRGENLSSRYIVVSRDSIYRSPVTITPYIDETRIDEHEIGRIVDLAYKEAGLRPEDVDTGAVILTGEAIRRENAKAIADVLADKGGEFVCATAGHNMEALLAAYGSGAALRSYQQDNKILNIDIGGGTTKLAVVEKGKVLETAAIYIGGRLVVVDNNQQIVRLDPGAVYIAEQLGYSLQIGSTVSSEQLQNMTDWMAEAILTCVTKRPLDPQFEELFLTPILEKIDGIDGVMFSGGVAEFVYNREEGDFGDLGKYLGQSIQTIIEKDRFPGPVLEAGECIRATVVGASEYSVQISGNTNFVSNHGLLPKRNIQVLKPNYEIRGDIDSEQLGEAIKSHFLSFDLVEGEAEVALAFRWLGPPEFERVSAFAKGIELGLSETIKQGKPLFLVLDGDLARTIGTLLKEEFQLSSDVISIDGIVLQDFDFIDIGRQLEPSQTIPVTVKSLIFQL